MSRYNVTIIGNGAEFAADTFAGAVAAIQNRISAPYYLETDSGVTDVAAFESESVLNGCGEREWTICVNCAVANSKREFAVVTEQE